MNINDILKRAQAAQLKKAEPPVKIAVKKVRVTFDANGNIQWPTEPKIRIELPQDQGAHVVGGECPHCVGGRYFHHLKREWGKCYRCNGKGTLDTRDMAFYQRRVEGAEAISTIRGCAA